MKMFKHRTKFEAIGSICVVILLVAVSVMAGTRIISDSSDNIKTFITNSNGGIWDATGANFQIAIYDLNGTGGTVSLPDGHLVTSHIRVTSNIDITGCGWNTIIEASSGLADDIFENYDTVNGVYDNNITIRNLKIDGSNLSAGYCGIRFEEVDYFLIDNIYAMNTSLDTFKIIESKHGTLSNLVSVDSGNHAVFVGYDSHYINIDNIVSHNPGTEHVCLEWERNGNRNTYLTVNNVVGYNHSNHGFFIRDCNYVTISNCQANYGLNAGFYIELCNNVMLTNCVSDTTTAAGRYCFEIEDNAKNIIINTCTANYSDEGAAKGFIVDGTNVLVTNCVVDNCKNLFQLTSATNNVTFSNNLCNNWTDKCYLKGTNVTVRDNRWTGISVDKNIMYIFNETVDCRVFDNDMNTDTQGNTKIAFENSYTDDDIQVFDNFGFDYSNYEVFPLVSSLPSSPFDGWIGILTTNMTICAYNSGWYYYVHT